MGTINVSVKYATAYSGLIMVGYNDGIPPWRRAAGLLLGCYLNGRDYVVSVYDNEVKAYVGRQLADYMPPPYAEDAKVAIVPWMSDDEVGFYKDLLYGATMDMEALDSNDPLLAAMLLQYEVLRSGGRYAIAEPE